MALNQYEKDANKQILTELGANFQLSEDGSQTLMEFMMQFMNTHDITLINLRPTEKQALTTIAANILSAENVNFSLLNAKLLNWKKTLEIAVAGQDERLKTMHKKAAQGVAYDITYYAQKGPCSVEVLGSERDARYALKTVAPLDIHAPGFYSLDPVDPTHGTELRDIIDLAKSAVNANGLTGKVTIQIPLNYQAECHWRHASISFENGQLIASHEVDSMGRKGEIANAQLLNQAILDVTGVNMNVQRHFTGEQKNGSSCLDYTIKSILLERGEHNAITKAKSAEQLRHALVERLHEATIYKSRLVQKESYRLKSPYEIDPTIVDRSVFEDHVLAVELQREYDEHKADINNSPSEQELFARAQKAARDTISFFGPAKTSNCHKEAKQTSTANFDETPKTVPCN